MIPLLAGQGKGRDERIDRLEYTFSGERPVRSALRTWLRRFERDTPYFPRSPFWFVNAVIGECALVQISGDFASEYLDRMFAQGTVGDVRPDVAAGQFDHLVNDFVRGGQLKRDEELWFAR